MSPSDIHDGRIGKMGGKLDGAVAALELGAVAIGVRRARTGRTFAVRHHEHDLLEDIVVAVLAGDLARGLLLEIDFGELHPGGNHALGDLAPGNSSPNAILERVDANAPRREDGSEFVRTDLDVACNRMDTV